MSDELPRRTWRIPADAEPYGQTPEFDEHSTPAGIRGRHDTKAGVWGELVVRAGSVAFFDLRPGGQTRELGPGRWGIIEPQAPHRVEPGDGARFCVVFHRRP
jgi:tellurite resistance-related uncharacterized protein